MKNRLLSVGLAFSVLAAGATGCGGGGGGATLTPPPVNPPPPPPPAATFSTTRVFPALSFVQPVALLQRPGDASQWYVVERAGVVRVFDNDPNVVRSSVVIDYSATVDSGPGEAGLLGMAFHPNFATNGFVFLSYTVTGTPLVSRIDRFTSSDGGLTIDPNPLFTIISASQNQGNHNGGQIAFGPDGFLYGGFGDGGGGGDPANNAQNTNNILGAIIRIDVDQGSNYSIPAGNPFRGNALCRQGVGNADCPEIFAWGLRNPWRWSFDRQTGELYVGDVGQNSFEEIDRVSVGENYGWRIREGANCYNATTCPTAGLVDPIHEYGRNDGTSVTGGYVYRGTAMPALVGRYVFGDFSTGRIWSIDASAQSLVSSELVVDTSLSIASFAEAEDGELFIVDISGGLHQLIQN